jgi:hypothetical protein
MMTIKIYFPGRIVSYFMGILPPELKGLFVEICNEKCKKVGSDECRSHFAIGI